MTKFFIVEYALSKLKRIGIFAVFSLPIISVANTKGNSTFAPTSQATSITFSSYTNTSATVNWSNGNGSSRAVFICAGGSADPLPVNGTTYTAYPAYSSGTQIGSSGWYCIYNNTGSSVTVTNLTTNSTYKIMVLEYTGSPGTESYLTTEGQGNPVSFTASATTLSVSGTPALLTTTYGTPSTTTTFNVSGINTTAAIQIALPAGYEASTVQSGPFSSSLSIGSAGNIPSTPIYIRLTQLAGAQNYSGSVVTSSSGATSVSLMTNPNSVVNRAALSITAFAATNIYGGKLLGAVGSLSFTPTGLQNSETIGSITTSFGSGSGATDPVNTYVGTSIVSNPVGGSFKLSNYTITPVAANITVHQAPLAITSNAASKVYGTVLVGGTQSPAFTSTGLKNSEIIGNVIIAYGQGSSATDAVGSYVGTILSSGAAGGNFNIANYSVQYLPGTMTVNQAALVISANNISKTYGGILNSAPVSTAFTTVGLANSETVSSISLLYGIGSSVLSAVNTYSGSVVGSSPGGGSFNPLNYLISFLPGNIIVNPAPLVITAMDSVKVYGTLMAPVSTSTKFFTAGLQNQETVGSVTIGYNFPSSLRLAAGIHPVAAIPSIPTGGTFNRTNYTITYVSGTVTVLPASLTITAADVNKNYGVILSNGIVSSGFSSAGLQNYESIGNVSVSYGLGSAAASSTGNYKQSVVLNSATNGTFLPANYTINYIAGNVIVNPATLTITAVNQSRSFASANLPFTALYSGFINGDNASVLTPAPVLTSTGTITSVAGIYNITENTVTAQNYTVLFSPGTLTIQAISSMDQTKLSSLLISAGVLSPVFDMDTPAYSASVTNGVTSIMVTSTPFDPTATIQVNGVAVGSGVRSTPIPLVVGDNTIQVKVTGEGGMKACYYVVTVTRAASNNAELSSLVINNGLLKPDFFGAETSYSVSVPYKTVGIRFITTLADNNATLSINGISVKNSFSDSIHLAVGYTTITIKTLAQDNSTQLTYILTIQRDLPEINSTAVARGTPSNILTPNGDGVNDSWAIKDISLYPANKVTVYDRSGLIVFTKQAYQNDWQGTYRGSPLAVGTYYYVVDLGNGVKATKGFITILKDH